MTTDPHLENVSTPSTEEIDHENIVTTNNDTQDLNNENIVTTNNDTQDLNNENIVTTSNDTQDLNNENIVTQNNDVQNSNDEKSEDKTSKTIPETTVTIIDNQDISDEAIDTPFDDETILDETILEEVNDIENTPKTKDPVLEETKILKKLKVYGISNFALMGITGLTLLGSVAFIGYTIYAGYTTQNILLAIFCCFILLMVEFSIRYFNIFDPKKVYKPLVVEPFLQRRLQTTDYEWKQSFIAKADIKDAKIAGNKWLTAEASDRFKANYRGCQFDFYDLRLTHFAAEKTAYSAYDHPEFAGQLYILTLKEPVKCPIRITEYSETEKENLEGTISLIKTGCVEFDNRFLVDVLVDEQPDNASPKLNAQEAMNYAREILTKELAKTFVEADDRADSRTRMYFNGNKLYLTHENPFDPFEYRYSKDKKLSFKDLKARIKAEISRIEKILDALLDGSDILYIQEKEDPLANVGYLEDVWHQISDPSLPEEEDSDNENNVTENCNNENNVVKTELTSNEVNEDSTHENNVTKISKDVSDSQVNVVPQAEEKTSDLDPHASSTDDDKSEISEKNPSEPQAVEPETPSDTAVEASANEKTDHEIMETEKSE